MLLCFMLACFIPANAKKIPGEKVGVTFAELAYDFGTVHADAGTVDHTFTFTNAGNGNVAIASASASCGCTKPEYTKRPVAPGGEGSVKVIFNTSGQRGEINKEVKIRMVAQNGKTERITLRISGVVVP